MLIISTLFDSPFLRSSWIPLIAAFENIYESLKPESFKFGGVSLVIWLIKGEPLSRTPAAALRLDELFRAELLFVSTLICRFTTMAP